MSSSMTSRTGRRAFTLVELLVVIAIIGLLAGLLLPLLGTVTVRARKAQAQKEVREILSAIQTYHMQYNVFPPDTADWGGAGMGYTENMPGTLMNKDIDPRSIHRYLASPVRSAPGKKVTQQMSIKEDRLDPDSIDADGIGIYCDPWGKPYHIDCVHMYYSQGTWKQKGWPYRNTRGAASEPTDLDKRKMVLDFKVVSFGPDMKSTAYPFEEDPGSLDDDDDIRSW